MLYTNENLYKVSKDMDWGTLTSFNLGECGRGRREIRMISRIPQDTIEKGLHTDLTIGFTRNGKPRINRGSDEKLFMALSSYGGYTRRGSGYIAAPAHRKNQLNIIELGNGADGDAGRIGTWRVAVFEIPADDYIIKVHFSGSRSSVNNTYYVIKDGKVIEGKYEDIVNFYDINNIDCPIPQIPNDYGFMDFEPGYWSLLYSLF